MNPYDISQTQQCKSFHTLDGSQPSDISIKIFNENDKNVVIHLFRNDKKNLPERFKNSFSHRRQLAGADDPRKCKCKSSLLTNLYRRTFGPTLDETVLVGMESLEMAQECPCNDGSTGNNNELAWDNSLLPINVKPTVNDSISTSTSKSLINKNLCTALINKVDYCPPCTEVTEPHCPCPPCEGVEVPPNLQAIEESLVPDSFQDMLNDISCSETLSKHVSESNEIDITRTPTNDLRHDNSTTLTNMTTNENSVAPSLNISELNGSADGCGNGATDSETLKCPEKCSICHNIQNLYKLESKQPNKYICNNNKTETKLQILNDVTESSSIEENSYSTTTSFQESCKTCKKALKYYQNNETETEEISATTLLPRLKNISFNCSKLKTFFAHSFFKERKNTSVPFKNNKNSFINVTKYSSNTNSSSTKSSLKDVVIKKPIVVEITQSKLDNTNDVNKKGAKNPEPDLKITETKAHEVVPCWELKKCYPTARFVSENKLVVSKNISRLTAGSDKKFKGKYRSSSTSCSFWKNSYTLLDRINRLPKVKAKALYDSIKKLENKIQHIYDASSSSISLKSSSLLDSQSYLLHQRRIHRQRSGANEKYQKSVRRQTDLQQKINELTKLEELEMKSPKSSTKDTSLQTPNTSSSSTFDLNVKEDTRRLSANYERISIDSDMGAQKLKPSYYDPKKQSNIRPSTNPQPKFPVCGSGCRNKNNYSEKGNCIISKNDNKHWDHNNTNKGRKRKPILEKIIDALSDSTGRSKPMNHNCCCSGRIYGEPLGRIKPPRRVPILEKFMDAFTNNKNVPCNCSTYKYSYGSQNGTNARIRSSGPFSRRNVDDVEADSWDKPKSIKSRMSSNYYEETSKLDNACNQLKNGRRKSGDSSTNINNDVDVEKLNRKNRKPSQRDNRDSVNSGKRISVNSGKRVSMNKRDSINSGKRDLINSGKRDSMNSGKKDLINSSKRDSINSGKKDSMNSCKRDLIKSGKKDSINSSKRDSMNSCKNDSINSCKRDSMNSGKRDSINSCKRDSMNSCKRDSMNSGKRDSMNSCKRDSMNSCKKDSKYSSGKRDSMNTCKKNAMNSGKRDSMNSSKRDSMNSCKKDSMVIGKRDSMNSDKRDSRDHINRSSLRGGGNINSLITIKRSKENIYHFTKGLPIKKETESKRRVSYEVYHSNEQEDVFKNKCTYCTTEEIIKDTSTQKIEAPNEVSDETTVNQTTSINNIQQFTPIQDVTKLNLNKEKFIEKREIATCTDINGNTLKIKKYQNRASSPYRDNKTTPNLKENVQENPPSPSPVMNVENVEKIKEMTEKSTNTRFAAGSEVRKMNFKPKHLHGDNDACLNENLKKFRTCTATSSSFLLKDKEIINEDKENPCNISNKNRSSTLNSLEATFGKERPIRQSLHEEVTQESADWNTPGKKQTSCRIDCKNIETDSHELAENSSSLLKCHPDCEAECSSSQLSLTNACPQKYNKNKGCMLRNKIPLETRYAITRLTRYEDFTTYEIMKSTKAKPRKIPCSLEKIFIEKEAK